MAGYQVQFTLVGQKEIIRTFESLGEAVRELKPAWDGVVDQVLIPMAKEQFATEGTRVGKWQELNEDYAKWKERHGFSPRILQKTGLMKESLERSGPGKGIGVLRTTDDYLEYGTAVPYAIHHQLGHGHLPRRQILIFWREDWQKVMRVIRKHIYKVSGISAQPG